MASGCVAVTTSNDEMRMSRLRRFTERSTSAAPAGTTTPQPFHSSVASPTAVAAVDSVGLFNMGFEAATVGNALVEARGDAIKALALLQKQTTPTSSTTTQDETDADSELEMAIALSLEPQKKNDASSSSSLSSSGVNPLWAPPRYLPTDHRSLEAGPRTLSLLEEVQVRDGGYGWQRATAFLDTGNQAMTLIDTRFAARHALYIKDPTPELFPHQSAGGFGMQAESWLTLRGVVPGASTRAPVVTIALKVRDQEMLVPAAVSECTGHDLLLGADVIGRLFDAGFRLGAGSM